MRTRILLLFCFLWPLAALARDDIEQAIRQWFAEVRARLPGPASIEIGAIAATTQLPRCQRLAVERPSRERTWGATRVLVRCLDAAAWRIFVPVTIHVEAPYLVTARALPAGRPIEAGDLVQLTGDLAQLPANVLTAPAEAIGRVTVATLASGQPLRADQLRAPRVIQAGQNVVLVYRGEGFTARNEGKALASALLGQSVSVRLATGQVITGIAQADGTVEVR